MLDLSPESLAFLQLTGANPSPNKAPSLDPAPTPTDTAPTPTDTTPTPTDKAAL